MTSPSYVGMVDALKLYIQNYTNFNGRSTRSEYWYAALGIYVVDLVLLLLGKVLVIFTILASLLSLATIVPSLAICIRRLHDIGKSGWWYLLGFVPIVGWIILIIWFIRDSQPGDNQWGPNPKGINPVE